MFMVRMSCYTKGGQTISSISRSVSLLVCHSALFFTFPPSPVCICSLFAKGFKYCMSYCSISSPENSVCEPRHLKMCHDWFSHVKCDKHLPVHTYRSSPRSSFPCLLFHDPHPSIAPFCYHPLIPSVTLPLHFPQVSQLISSGSRTVSTPCSHTPHPRLPLSLTPRPSIRVLLSGLSLWFLLLALFLNQSPSLPYPLVDAVACMSEIRVPPRLCVALVL